MIPLGGGHLLRRRAPSAGGHRRGVRGRVRRLLRQLHPLRPRSAAGRASPSPRRRSSTRRGSVNPLSNWYFTARLGAAHRRPRLVPHRPRSSSRACAARRSTATPARCPPWTADSQTRAARPVGGLPDAGAARGAAGLGAAAGRAAVARAGRCAAAPAGDRSPRRDAPLMHSIVPLIFLLFLMPGIVYGYVAGTVKSHRDIIAGMSKSMSTMGYYLVHGLLRRAVHLRLRRSRTSARCSRSRAPPGCKAMGLPGGVTIVGIILLSALRSTCLIGSASAKWALLGADLRAHADAAGHLAGADPGRLPRGRLDHQHHHAADAVLPADRGRSASAT